MEHQQENYSIQDNEEEEGVTLLGRQSKHSSQNNKDDNATDAVVSVDGNGNGSPISRSGSSTLSSDVDQPYPANGTTDEGDQKDGEEDYSTADSSVYFDQLLGIWKCRHCNWTYCGGSPCIDHIQKHKGHLHVVTKEPCFGIETDEGAQSVDGVSNKEVNGASWTISEIATNRMLIIPEISNHQSIITKEINSISGEILDDEGLSGSTSVNGSFVDQSIKSEPSDHGAITDENIEIIEEIDEEGTDYDVEKVLEKQNTHDLYCPNCHSCITRKVVLHRRRRKIRTARRKPKQDKLVAIVESEKDAHSTPSANDHGPTPVVDGPTPVVDGPTPEADDYNRERGPDVFRCLSCFSFFIPTGDGFKLFRTFKDNKRNADVQDSQNIPAPDRNWFFSIFTTDKPKTTIWHDGGVPSAVLEGTSDVLPQQGSDNSRSPLSDGVMINNGQLAEDTTFHQYEKGFSSKPLTDTWINSGVPEKDSFRPQQEANPQLSSTHISVKFEQSEVKIDKTVQIAKGNEKPVQTDQASLIPGSLFPKGDLVVDDSFKGPQLLDQVSINIGEKAFSAMENKNTGNDVIVIIEKGLEENAAFQRIENIGGSAEDSGSLPLSGTRTYTHVDEQRDAGTGAAHEWEILKSIVYGGLTESITSLGVVTSAAGSGAATLNILALGLANLIGGLFVIGHNLVDMKNDHHGGTSSEPNQQEDRYRKTLGRRENFPLHATIAILSFLIFGLLPPVIYGFSFRQSGDRDLKLAAVGSASLVCIILLAIGKAHVQRPPKKYISTVFYYVSVGFMASGASYVAGDLVDMMMQKFGWLDSQPSAAVTLSLPTPKPFDMAWGSY